MAFDNHYPNRKDKRKPYYSKGAKIDRSCRPGGDCPYCRGNRQHKHTKKTISLDAV